MPNRNTVIAYFRDPPSFAISRPTKEARNSNLIALTQLAPSSQAAYNFTETVIKWRSDVHPGRFQVRLFERHLLDGRDRVLDFMAACQSEPGQDQLPFHPNQSLPEMGLALPEEIHCHVARRWIDGKLNISRCLLASHVLQHRRSGIVVQAYIDGMEAYRQHYGSSNEWVRHHFFPDRPYPFKPFSSVESTIVEAKLDQEDVRRVGRLNAKIWLTKVARPNSCEHRLNFSRLGLPAWTLMKPKQSSRAHHLIDKTS